MTDAAVTPEEAVEKPSKLPLILGLVAALIGGGGGFYAAYAGLIFGGESNAEQTAVHDEAGTMVSFRGALGFDKRIELPPLPANPCDICDDKPCLKACPVGALTGAGYDVPACHAYLDQPEGQECLDAGCQVRLACPISQSYGRAKEQSAFHMGYFHPAKGVTK